MRATITSARSFIGRPLVSHLRQDEWEVILPHTNPPVGIWPGVLRAANSHTVPKKAPDPGAPYQFERL